MIGSLLWAGRPAESGEHPHESPTVPLGVGDLTEAIHGHPEDDGRPALTFTPIVPTPGDYKVWVQVQRRGVVITVPFWIRVAGALGSNHFRCQPPGVPTTEGPAAP